MKKGIIIGLVWLVIINCFSILAANRVNLEADTAYPWIHANDFRQEKTWNLLRVHDNWDAGWFLSIVKNGYTHDATGASTLSNIAFFPLYPILVKLLSLIIANQALSGFIVSTICLLLACGLLYKLVKKFHSESSASLTLITLLVFPTSFFLNSIYSESLFLFLSLLFFYLLFEKKIWLAGLVGLCAALTRITGLFLVVPFFIELLMLYRSKLVKPSDFFAVLLVPIGTASFFLFHLVRFGDFFLYFKVQDAWGRKFAINLDHIFFGSSAGIVNTLMDIAFIIVGIVLAVLIFMKLRKSYAAYIVCVIIAALATGTPMSIGRIMLVLFPLFIFLGTIKNETLKFGWILASTLFMGLYTLLYVNNYWAG